MVYVIHQKTVFAMSIPTGVRFIASLRFAVKIHVILRYALAHVEVLRLTMREEGVARCFP